MSDTENQNQENDTPEMTELDLLKNRARLMNLTFSNNIGVEALRAKITEKLAGNPETPEPEGDDTDTDSDADDEAFMANPLSLGAAKMNRSTSDGVAAPVRKLTLREYMQQEQMRLVRCRITNMDPKKKDLPGEIFTVANEYLGTVRKFVPFGEYTDDGFHIPYCIYEMMKTRKFLNIRIGRDRRTGSPEVSTQWASEFAIEVLEPLTEDELRNLAVAQISAGSIGSAEMV